MEKSPIAEVVFDELLWGAIAIEDVSVASPQHIVDQLQQQVEIELNGVLEQAPVVPLKKGKGALTSVGLRLLHDFLVTSFLLLIILGVAVTSHGVRKGVNLLL